MQNCTMQNLTNSVGAKCSGLNIFQINEHTEGRFFAFRHYIRCKFQKQRIRGQAIYVQRKIKSRSCNNLCSGKRICIIYSLCVL
jgi:hypothetical protein